jgi:glutamate 5-kinase
MTNSLVVVKVGTSCLTKDDGRLDKDEISNIVDQIAIAVSKGYRIILVTSGAIVSGTAELGKKANPNDIIFKQSCAAIGQSILMSNYRQYFKNHGLKVAQVLLTENDLSNRTSYLHICNVLDRLLQLNVIPIINENDLTSINEIIPLMKGYKINFSDNDILSVLIANATEADLVVILSTVDGLFDKNPKRPNAKLIRVVEKITPELKKVIDGKSKFGRGGMLTKLRAAEISMKSGIPLVIANSKKSKILSDILENKFVGTYFRPLKKGLPGIKKWIAYSAGSKGQIQVNDGAKKAIMEGASLLAAGIENVSGTFQIGEVVSIVSSDRKEFGRGIVNYTSEEINLIKGMVTSNIIKNLGYIRQKEIIIRKRMHLIK